MVLFGILLGWAWGTLTMKAALATRPAADLRARYAELQAQATRNTTYVQQASGQTTFAQIAIYDGFMLDTRVSVTYFCMICLFIYTVVSHSVIFMIRLIIILCRIAFVSNIPSSHLLQ